MILPRRGLGRPARDDSDNNSSVFRFRCTWLFATFRGFMVWYPFSVVPFVPNSGKPWHSWWGFLRLWLEFSESRWAGEPKPTPSSMFDIPGLFDKAKNVVSRGSTMTQVSKGVVYDGMVIPDSYPNSCSDREENEKNYLEDSCVDGKSLQVPDQEEMVKAWLS